MTREQVQDLLAMVQATYPNYNPPSKTAAVNAWTMALEEYNKDEVAMAFKMYMKTNKNGFAPVPGQLIENIHIINQPQELNEMEAWSLVSKAIQNSIYNSVEEYMRLPPIVQKAVGLPSQLKLWAIEEHCNMGVVMSQFQKCYRMEISRKSEFHMFPSDVKMIVEKTSENTYKAQIQEKRDFLIENLSESEKPIKIKNKKVGISKQIEEKLKEMRCQVK